MMKNFHKIIVLVLSLFAFSFGVAQTITGTITDPDGLGVPGATVTVKGTQNSVDTDLDGNFTLNDVPSDGVLVVTALDLDAKEIPVGGKTSIAIALTRLEEQALKEVVAIGYGSVRKSDATGAVDVIGTDDFNKGITTSPEQLLQGKVAGINITSTSGEPGAGISISIRGIGSIRSGNGPLYVIDGVPIVIDSSPGANAADIGSAAAKNPLNFINSSDIETITVLKDASATAIYGSRGANGVVIVTTKKGKRGSNKINFNVATSWGDIANELDLLNANQYNQYAPKTNQFGSNVDAFKAITRTSFSKEYGFSIAGGSDNNTYRISLGAMNQEGVLKNSGLNKYTLNGSLTSKFFNDDRLTIDTNFGASYIKDIGAPNSDNVGYQGNLLIAALRWNPTRSFTNPDGSYFQTTTIRNPLALLDYYTDFTKTYRIYGNIAGTLKLVKGLSYKFLYGLDNSNSERNIAISSLFNSPTVVGQGWLGIQNLSNTYQLFQNTLNYDGDITNKLKINALVGWSYEKTLFSGRTDIIKEFPNITDQNLYIENQFLGKTRNFNDQSSKTGTSIKLQSYFARSIFTYADKYILTATIRADGSSRFGSENQYGYFPSAAFAWKIDKEGFLPDAFRELKLRLGWGITGNEDFDPLAARQIYGYNADNSPKLITAANPELKWESTTSYNIGIDYKIKNRLSGSIDVYRKETNDLLFQFPVNQPGPIGAKFYKNLDGVKIINEGLEFSLNYDIIQNEDFQWSMGGNVAFLKNEIQSDQNGVSTGAINGQGLSDQNSELLYDGQPLYAFYLPVLAGFSSTGAEVFKDVNGDGEVYTSFSSPGEGDRAFLGSPLPDINVGFYTTLNYKNWDFTVNMYGSYGQKIYNNTANAILNAASFKSGTNVTTQVTQEADFLTTSPSLTMNSRYLESGDFLRLSNATLGYTFKGDKNGFANWINTLRIFFTGQNLFVITPYSGFDPEVNINKDVDGVASRGIDYSAYPKARTFTIGLNVNF